MTHQIPTFVPTTLTLVLRESKEPRAITSKLGSRARTPNTARLPIKCRAASNAKGDTASPKPESSEQLVQSALRLLDVKGVVFDMDGTLVIGNIDFVDMRERTGIPIGDLFSVMQQWTEPSKIEQAMNVINEIESGARSTLRIMDGLQDLLDFLYTNNYKIALVTRNTTPSVQAFYDLLGKKYEDMFSITLTREFAFVKPDKRIMNHIAEIWGMDPENLLMVGDSREDVEVGKAAGSPACLISGGGNETAAKNKLKYDYVMQQGEPDVTIRSLSELTDMFRLATLERNMLISLDQEPLENAAIDLSKPMQLLDDLFRQSYLKAAVCTFSRLTKAFGCEDTFTYNGDQVLHFASGDGLLTKLFGSQGIHVYGLECHPMLLSLLRSRGIPGYFWRPEKYIDIPDFDALDDELYSLSRKIQSNQPSFSGLPSTNYFNSVIAYDSEFLFAPHWARNLMDFKRALDEMWTVSQFGANIVIEMTVWSGGDLASQCKNEYIGKHFPQLTIESLRDAAEKRGFSLMVLKAQEETLSLPLAAMKNEIKRQLRHVLLYDSKFIKEDISSIAEIEADNLANAIHNPETNECKTSYIRGRLVLCKGK